MTWWRRERPDPTRPRSGVPTQDERADLRTGVVLARLETIVERFDVIASRLDATLAEHEGGRVDP